jgi:RNA-directed DNA polymerase
MTDSQTQSPTGDTVSSWHQTIPPALNENMLERIVASENVKRAWRQVRRNHGAPGVDGMTVEEFPTYARAHWQEVRQALIDGRYRPSAVRRVEIPKPNGGVRLLGIPTVIDRVIQQAIAQVLTPIFDPEFSESSFGFRPGRSAHDAVKQVRTYISKGYSVAIEVDLSKYFDEVNHDVLMVRVARKIRDKRVLRLIGLYLRAGVLVNEIIEPTSKGVPQGGPLSPLLANIMLDDFDRELESRGHKFARYCDDFVILVKSPRAGERVKQSVSRFLEKKLKLKINREKSKTGKASKCKFLGFTFPGKTIRWSVESLEDFKHQIRTLTGRSWRVSWEHRIAKLNEYLRGWMSYFGHSQYWTPIPELDSWIRRRIRCCYWKQWRYAKTKIRALTKRGLNLPCAIQLAMGSHGPWYYSDHTALAQALTNSYIHDELGLVSIRDLWTRLHYPENPRGDPRRAKRRNSRR